MAETARMFSKGELFGAVVAALAVGFFVGSMVMELRQPAQSAPAGAVAQQAAPAPGMGQDDHDHAAELARIRELEVATAQKPDQAAWIELGNLYFDTHQALKSIAAYDKAAALGPVSADVLTDRGIMRREASQTEQALADFDAALKLDPRHQNALYNKGVVQLHDKQDRAGAAATWERLVQVNPQAKTPDGRLLQGVVAGLKKGG